MQLTSTLRTSSSRNRPADAVLGSRTLSSLFAGPGRRDALRHRASRQTVRARSRHQDASELGALVYLVIRTSRWWPGVKPPEPKARRARE